MNKQEILNQLKSEEAYLKEIKELNKQGFELKEAFVSNDGNTSSHFILEDEEKNEIEVSVYRKKSDVKK